MKPIGPRLVDLAPVFLRHDANGGRPVDTLTEAQGVRFRCPRCGDHDLTIWFENRGVPTASCFVRGSSIADLSLFPRLDLGCWVGHITAGWISTSL